MPPSALRLTKEEVCSAKPFASHLLRPATLPHLPMDPPQSATKYKYRGPLAPCVGKIASVESRTLSRASLLSQSEISIMRILRPLSWGEPRNGLFTQDHPTSLRNLGSSLRSSKRAEVKYPSP